VYKVWDEERTAWLAMKLLREDLAQDRVFLRRFAREAETLALLQHPNIVRFYGVESAGRLAFILIDYVDGINLRTAIHDHDGRGMDSGELWQYLQPMCSALNYAHRQGIIHCDVKPANVMLHHSGAVLVSDFGISRMAEGTTMTMVGAGTPGYMAPEQVMGSAPTPETDIYALGVMMFEMLAGGERPFTGERARAGSTTGEQVRWEQVHLEPPPLRKLNPAVPRGLEVIIRRCLDKDPGARYPTMIDLLNDVQRVLGPGQPIPAGQPAVAVAPVERTPTPAPAAAWQPPVADSSQQAGSRRKGWLIGAGGVVLAVLIVGALALGGGLGKNNVSGLTAQTPTDAGAGRVVATLTEQARLLLLSGSKPTLASTLPPSDTPTPTNTEVPAATQRPTLPPTDNQPVSTRAPVPTSAPAPTATKAPPPTAATGGDADCNASLCPGGMALSCNSTYRYFRCTGTTVDGSCLPAANAPNGYSANCFDACNLVFARVNGATCTSPGNCFCLWTGSY
jgi:serine/threonine-protein kinase